METVNKPHSFHTAALLENVQQDLGILFASTSEAIMLIEPNGTIQAANDISADWLKLKADSLINKNIFQILTKFGVPIREWVYQVGNTKKILETSASVENRFIQIRLIPILDSSKSLTRLAIIGRDVTEQKRAENQVLELAGLLELKVLERTAKLEELNQKLAQDKRRAELLAGFFHKLMEDTRDYRQLLGHITAEITEIIGDLCLIAAYTPDLTGLEVVAISDQDVETLPRERDHFLNRTILFEENTFFRDLLDGSRFSIRDLTFEEGQKILPPEFAVQLGQNGLKALEVFPLQAGNQPIGTFVIAKDTGDYFSEDELSFIQSLISPIALAIQNARLVEQLTESQSTLRGLSQKLVQIQESQYSHLAKELHDSIGQDMTAININLNIMRSLLPENTPKDVFSRIYDTENLVKSSVDRMRSTMAEFRPPMLDQYGLAAALYWYSEQFNQRTKIPITIDDRYLKGTRMPVEIEIALFRIAQEALNNIAKHAKATRVAIELLENQENILMTITDNGTGFDTRKQPLDTARHWGTTIMCERARAINGHFLLRSVPGKGTQVIVRLRKKR